MHVFQIGTKLTGYCLCISSDMVSASCRQLQSTYSTPVKHQMALCIEALIKIDPDSQWTFIKAKGREKGHGDSNERSEVATLFPHLLQDNTHEVRMHMATAVGW